MSQSCLDTLIELMSLQGPSGQEEPVLAWCRERWAGLGAEVEVTPIGNVLAHAGGTGPRLLLQGHADEISFIVRSVDERGFVWLADGQGSRRAFHDRYPVGQPALILARTGERVTGVFVSPTGHVLSTRNEREERMPDNAGTVCIDIGVDSKDEAIALGVHPGAGVIWNPETRRYGHRYVGKAIDNRISIALMTHLLETVPADELRYSLTVAATVQEEIGLLGAWSLASPDRFDLAIAIDNGPLADYPGTDSGEVVGRLGGGPTLVYKDSMAHYDRRVINRLHEAAATNGIVVQETIYSGFASDGVALMRSGVPAALLAIPTRYTHSAFEMGDERDLESTLALLAAFVTMEAGPLPLGPS